MEMLKTENRKKISLAIPIKEQFNNLLKFNKIGKRHH